MQGDCFSTVDQPDTQLCNGVGADYCSFIHQTLMHMPQHQCPKNPSLLTLLRRESGDSPQNSSPSISPLPHTPVSAATSMTAGPARPIRLVYCDDKGRFQLDPEAVAVLQLVKEPVGVVSVCGRARQGKSFILNQGTYSMQIFSLAVLLSSMFIYNQMGGIDEAALDRLSLVTEMTKHIRVRASGGRSTASELGQFSPIFVWLLRDFYLDLVEDNHKITPRDYLELALRPIQGGGKDVASKNEIRESIRALFPDRECFPLVRPLSNENDLQRLDQIPMDKLRPEFRSGLDALTRFVFERTRPKQVGSTVMTGPIFARIIQSFLDAINNGAVPTITSSWQSVEEAECQRAYELATEVYMSAFDRSKPPEEAALREAHEDAVQKSVATFNATAVGTGSIRQKYEQRFQHFLKKAFEDIKRDAFREAYIQLDSVFKVLDELLYKYEATCHGPEKWRKVVMFLQQSLEGPLLDLIKKQIDQIGTEKSSLALKCRSIEDKMILLNKQLEASEKYKSEYLNRYEDAIKDKKKLADDYMSRITNLQSKCSSLEERCSSLSKTLDTARQESMDWKRKYEQVSSKQKAEEEQASAGNNNAEEAEEWKRKYDVAVRETKNALEKAAHVQDRANNQAQARESAIRAEFSSALAEKEKEIKDKTSSIEQAEQRLTTLSLELKISALKLQIKELGQKLESANATAQSYEREARMLEQEKIHLEQKYHAEFNRFEEVQDRCKAAEREAKRSTELADKARVEAVTAQKEKSEIQRIAMERLAQIERAERQLESLERQKA
ncbi:Guanylate-binding family protein [Forsythia ovata]|uniref:Guanylate-binding family protein n=1 Tax=Forsythia ovata TaxID=205694 RepID=A0ABD1S3B8_9LAMI